MKSTLLRLMHWKDAGNRDMFLFALVLLLSGAGLLVLYPASSVVALRQFGDSGYFFHKQLLWFFLGLIALFTMALTPLDLLRRLVIPAVFLAVVFLLLVFVPGIRKSVVSSKESFHRWIDLGLFSLQPSEFAKPVLVLYVADVLTRGGEFKPEYDFRRLLFPFLLCLTVLILIIAEPQYGTTVCLMLVLGCMVYLSGFPMLRLFSVALAALPLLYLLIVLWDYRLERFQVWLDPFAHRDAGGYQLVTAYRAFREGHFLGLDIASGFAHSYLTYGHTDFILAVFAEDFGWVGLLALSGLFAGLLWRSVYTLVRIDDPFAFLLGAGAIIMLFFQALLNMAVVTGLLPTTGVSLPFFSYGGSSLVVSFALAGILVNVSGFAGNGE